MCVFVCVHMSICLYRNLWRSEGSRWKQRELELEVVLNHLTDAWNCPG